jgi:hypothetical protein
VSGKQRNELTVEQEDALRAAAQQWGPRWKQALVEAWNGRPRWFSQLKPEEERVLRELQTVRGFKLDVYVVRKTAGK